MTLIKSISGIRGTIGGSQGDNLTPIDIVKFTTAYARFMSEKHGGKRLTIVVGRDARISGGMVNDRRIPKWRFSENSSIRPESRRAFSAD